MALANYADLVAAINGWLSRADMTTIAPDLIALAEAELNRVLVTVEMERRATATLASDSVAVPSDFAGLRSIRIDGGQPLEYAAPDDIFDNTNTGRPTYYTVSDGQFIFRPAPSSGEVVITYLQRIPALTAVNTTNWLMTKHPDLYLFASLAQAEFYNWNDARLPMIKGRVEEIIGQINAATQRDRYGGRRLRMESRVANIGVAA